jgi:hypothetical protein
MAAHTRAVQRAWGVSIPWNSDHASVDNENETPASPGITG